MRARWELEACEVEESARAPCALGLSYPGAAVRKSPQVGLETKHGRRRWLGAADAVQRAGARRRRVRAASDVSRTSHLVLDHTRR